MTKKESKKYADSSKSSSKRHSQKKDKRASKKDHKKSSKHHKTVHDMESPKSRDRISHASNSTATESDCSRDSTTNNYETKVMLAGPLARLREEWRVPAWFGIAESGQILDVPASFGTPFLLLRWPITLVILVSFTYEFVVYTPTAHFLGQYSTWGCVLSLVVCFFSLYNGHARPTQPMSVQDSSVQVSATTDDDNDSLERYMKVFWLLFNVALHVELMSFLIFWCFDFPQDPSRPITYGTIMMHGGVLLLLGVDGLVLNRIPTRLKHFWACLGMDCLYVLVACFHELAHINGTTDSNVFTTANDQEVVPSTTNLRGNVAVVEADMRPAVQGPLDRYLREAAPEDANDALYPALDFENYTGQAVALLILIPVVFAPLLFGLQYLLSLFSCGSVTGANRRYLEEQTNHIVVQRASDCHTTHIVRPKTPAVRPASRAGGRRPASRLSGNIHKKDHKNNNKSEEFQHSNKGDLVFHNSKGDLGASFNNLGYNGRASRAATRPPSRAVARPPSRAAVEASIDDSISQLP